MTNKAKNLTNSKFSIKEGMSNIFNPKIRKACKNEMSHAFSWNGSTMHNYMTVGIGSDSIYIPKIKEIIKKYESIESRYLEKKVELDEIINSLN